MSEETTTPLEKYIDHKIVIDTELGEAKVEISRLKSELRNAEARLENSQGLLGRLSDTFIEEVYVQGGLYGAVFELTCNETFELPRDLRVAESADFIARQLIRFNGELEQTSEPLPVLVISVMSGVVSTNSSGSSYPAESDIHHDSVSWVNATLMQTQPDEILKIQTEEKHVPFAGLLKSVVSIDLSVISFDEVHSRIASFDHDSWLEGPFFTDRDYRSDTRLINMYKQFAEKESQVVVAADELLDGQISGLFVGRDVIRTVFNRINASQGLGHSNHKLKEMLELRGLDV